MLEDTELKDTCTLILGYFSPVPLFFLKICHPVWLLKTVLRLLERSEYVSETTLNLPAFFII